MLELVDIKKEYYVADGVVNALKGISLKFRKNEFVSILGASGCGKTTLLNIIGGLDQYTSGDLIIEGKSTKEYGDGDWDTYRNHSIGFIFQSYHLIPHQTILQNVELALLIAGVDKEERRRRAIEALEKVGLGDKLGVRPNQLSGGQAQRVAIARALINDPEIVLADEPTGALDSKTSVQIMELLKEISKDRLVIMVTHNPELADEYSTRIIRLLDGEVIDDSMPYDGKEQTSEVGGEEGEPEVKKTNKGKKKKASMSPAMAFSLSLKNLLSKRKRTAMVSFAGSIGIIGVSMVLAISSGVQAYIASMENDMLSGFPLSVTESAVDYSALMDVAASVGLKPDIKKLDDRVYIDSLIETLMGMNDVMKTNVISSAYIDYVEKMPHTYYNALQYNYGLEPAHNIYTTLKLDNDDEGEEVSVTGIRTMYTAVLGEVGKTEGNEKYTNFAQIIPTVTTFEEMPDNYNYVLTQYDILATNTGKAGKELTENDLKEIFENKDSVIMVINDNATTDLVLGQFGYFTQEEFLAFAERADGVAKGDYDGGKDAILQSYLDGKEFSFFLDEGNESTFKWYPNDTVYTKTTASDMLFHPDYQPGVMPAKAEYKYLAYSADFAESRDKSDDIDLKVKVILQKKKGVSYGCLNTGLYYTKALTDHTRETALKSEVVKYINEKPEGQLQSMPFNYHYTYDGVKHSAGAYGIPLSYYLMDSSKDMMSAMMSNMMGGGGDEYATLRVKPYMLGGGTLPVSFKIYPLDFENKDLVTDYLDGWNKLCADGAEYSWTDADGSHTVTLEEGDKINYNDQVGLIIFMVNTMIEMITIALVAFTALSLVVSTVMVGIITYVSVVERIKEIGILRSVGARKRDIKQLFNAETFIIGLASGIVGIAVTYLISLILNLILGALFGIYTIAALPWWQAVIMVVISVVLTLISGLIPAAAAAQKDPVVALRTE